MNIKILSALIPAIAGFALFMGLTVASPASGEAVTNSIGMRLIAVAPGNYQRGSDSGDYDERPVHEVTISGAFLMSAMPVTNEQYELFSPDHRALRGARGFSIEDDEAALFVSWTEAVAFCVWLSEKEGKPYRLPTEAEWEYACRAGTTSAFSTGDLLPEIHHRNQKIEWNAVPVSLKVGTTPPNAWGLHDMHGLVEEWCADWYGPYKEGHQTDPTGYATGHALVTRGGSHGTELFYLRSANRSGALPEDKHWLIGFRVVQGDPISTAPLPTPAPERWGQNVEQTSWPWSDGPHPERPYFDGPIPFVNIPPDSEGPLFSGHNHCPDITALPNGDLLATWYTCREEEGRELAVAAARFRRANTAWDAPSLFYKIPDRNMHATAILWDRDSDKIFHFQGISCSYGWANLALFLRVSRDNGATWSEPHWINREHGLRNMPIAGAIKTRNSAIIIPCDAVTGGNGGSAIHVSLDGGDTWQEPCEGTSPPDFSDGATGGLIAGIHAGVVELSDGRLMALGRGDAINQRMPKSVSSDMGKSWVYSASPFPPISGGQRLVLIKLTEGPILFVSFTDPRTGRRKTGMQFTGASGQECTGTGMFAALSFDDGETWPIRKLITPGMGEFDGGGHTKTFQATPVQAEHGGYLAATQAPDGVIHLISSRLHYRFNLAWLKAPATL